MPIATSDPRALLDLWATALPLNAPAREALLAAEPGFVARTLGAQRRRLVQALHAHVGEVAALRCRCPACAAQVSFDVSLSALLDALPAADAASEHRLEEGAWQLRFRLPAPADLLALNDEPEEQPFAAALLRRCLIDARHDGCPAEELPAALCELISVHMEALDPAASLAFDVTCTDCAHAWSAPFDPARALMAFVHDEAEALLLDIDTLAQRYGWSEDQILALPPLRRQAYLQLARRD
jgi:hypothetical protein